MGLSIDTIDVWGVRALHDAYGAEEAARMTRCLAIAKDYETFPGVNERTGIGTGVCRFNPKNGHGEFTMHLDDVGNWLMGASRLKASKGASARIPETIVNGMVGRQILDLLSHPWLDETMIVEEVSSSGTSIRIFTLTNTSRPVVEMAEMLARGMRP